MVRNNSRIIGPTELPGNLNLEGQRKGENLRKFPTAFRTAQEIFKLKKGLTHIKLYLRRLCPPLPYKSSSFERKPSLQAAPIGFSVVPFGVSVLFCFVLFARCPGLF